MEKIKEYWSDEIKELLLFTINDVLVLSKVIEWSKIWNKKSKQKLSIEISINWKPYVFSELSNYFNEQDFLNVPLNYLNSLYRLVLELKIVWKKIEFLSEQEKISIFDFVTDIIDFREKQARWNFLFDQKIKDMIMMELWLDIVDKVWDAKNETLALLEVLLIKK